MYSTKGNTVSGTCRISEFYEKREYGLVVSKLYVSDNKKAHNTYDSVHETVSLPARLHGPLPNEQVVLARVERGLGDRDAVCRVVRGAATSARPVPARGDV